MSGDVSTGPGLPSPAHAEFEELAAGYALDALEPEEEDRFLAHLPGCGRCGVALTQHLAVAAQLAWAVDPVPALPLPPALAVIAATSPRTFPEDPFHPQGLPTTSRVLRRPAVRRGSGRERPTLFPGARRGRVLAAAGALGVAALLTVVSLDAVSRNGGIATVQADSSEQALLAVNDPAAAVGRLVAVGQSAHGTAVVSQGHAWLVLDGLAPSGPGKRYVAWEITGFDTMRAAAAFVVEDQGVTAVDLGPVPPSAVASTRYAVTLEEPGASLPSSPSKQQVLNPASPTRGLQ